jgi:hypothetical protein
LRRALEVAHGLAQASGADRHFAQATEDLPRGRVQARGEFEVGGALVCGGPVN